MNNFGERNIMRRHSYLGFCLENEKGLTLISVFFRILSALMPTGKIWILAWFLNSLKDMDHIMTSFIILIGYFLLEYFLNQVVSYVGVHLNTRISVAYDIHLTEKKSRILYAQLENYQVRNLIDRVSEDCSGKMQEGLWNRLGVWEYIIRIGGIVFTILYTSIYVGIVVAVLFLVLIPIIKKCGEDDYLAYEQASEQFRKAKYLSTLFTKSENVDERKVFHSSKWLNQKWESWYQKGRIFSKNATQKNFLKIKAGSMMTVAAGMIIATAMLWPVKKGSMSVGLYISTITGVWSLIQLMGWKVALILEDFISNRLYLKDYIDFINLKEEKVSSLIGHRTINTIEFRQVRFHYPECEKEILAGINFTLYNGKTYALVGENGSGKSTIVKLLLGLYDDYEGSILLDGRELREISKEERIRLCSCAFQDFAHYEVSVKDNILLGEELINEETMMEEVLAQLGMLERIKQLPNELHTVLGRLEKDAVNLSGGEWQRIAIARSLIRHSTIQIMDEPTASLDPIHEKEIYDLLIDKMKQGIGIFITHRLGGVRNADQILVLKEGIIKEQGTFEELTTKPGMFRRMYELQKGWYV